MKNIIYLVIIIACAGLIIFGLVRNNASQPIQVASPTTLQTAPSATFGTASASIGQNVQHFRPDLAVSADNSSASAEQVAERNFLVTSDLLARMYLIDTYKPGTCYGAPVAVPQAAIDSLVSANPPLSNFLKQQYNLKTDLEIYNKLKQLQGIALTETASSKYNFTFMDGQCQTVTSYEGSVTVSGDSVSSAVVSNQISRIYQ